MTTSQKQILGNGEARSMFSREDSHASRSVMPGSEEARKMTVTSGLTCTVASMKSGPVGSLLKMLLASSRWSSKARLLTWQVRQLFSVRLTAFEDTNSERPLPYNASATTLKVTDIPSSRCLYRLVPSELHTDETECSSSDVGTMPFLKTPCTADSYTDSMKSKGVSGTSGTLAQEIVNGYAEKHRGLLLPTPVVVDNPHPSSKVTEQGRRYNEKAESSHSMGLSDLAYHQLLPTPIATDISHKQRVDDLKQAGGQTMASRANGANRPNGLSDFIRFYEIMPTPRSNVVVKLNLDNPKLAERHKGNLEEEVAKMVVDGLLPTPTAIEGVKWTNTWNPNSQMGQRLSAMAGSGMLPTPTTRDWKGETNPGVRKVGSGCIYGDTLPDTVMREAKKENIKSENAGKTSRLSPLFTEEMMGFPFLWTTLPFLSETGGPKASRPMEMP